MKKRFSVRLIAIITVISISLLSGCAELNQARVEQKYGPPAKKSTIDDKTIYSYYFSGRRQMCVDFHFDKDGRLVNKKGYYDERCTQIDPWLNRISGGEPARINITGKWQDPDEGNTYFGWGGGHLRQEGNKVSGAIGNYNVNGVVSGKTVYLIFSTGGIVYYKARLEIFQDLLAGNYFNASDKEQTQGYPISLAKTVQSPK